ncbi:hypothetical protein ACFL6D_00910, partial [Spirochaetota bacterium]
MRIFIACFLLLITTSFPAAISGGEPLSFLKLGGGVEGQAMGAYVAYVTDATAAFWNPAALLAIDSTELNISYSLPFNSILGNDSFLNYLNDIFVVNASYGMTVKKHDNSLTGYGFNILHVNSGEMQGYDLNAEELYTFSAKETAFSVSAARYILPKLQSGLSVKAYTQDLSASSSFDAGFDIGLRYLVTDTFNLSFVAYDPFTIRSFTSANRPFKIRTGIAFALSDAFSASAQADYHYNKGIAFN